MNVQDLQSTRNNERRTDSLQSLPDSFYTDAEAFVSGLRAEREAVAAEVDDPFDSEEIDRLTNSIKTAENTIEAIYERRVGKVVKLASLDAAGMDADNGGLTAEERDLFVSLTDAIEHNRQRVLDGADQSNDSEPTDAEPAGDETETAEPTPIPSEPTAADRDPGAGSPSSEPPAPEPEPEPNEPTGSEQPPAADESGVTDELGAADAMGAPAGTARTTRPDRSGANDTDLPESPDSPENGVADPSNNDDNDRAAIEERTADTDSSATNAIERATIRITRDVGEIMGIDERVYRLASDEVVRLPAANAKPLLDRDAAERIE